MLHLWWNPYSFMLKQALVIKTNLFHNEILTTWKILNIENGSSDQVSLSES